MSLTCSMKLLSCYRKIKEIRKKVRKIFTNFMFEIGEESSIKYSVVKGSSWLSPFLTLLSKKKRTRKFDMIADKFVECRLIETDKVYMIQTVCKDLCKARCLQEI